MTSTQDDEITNSDRAERCRSILIEYTDFDPVTNLIDFLADARHWCDRQKESFARLDRIAYQHYAAEVNEPTLVDPPGSDDSGA